VAGHNGIPTSNRRLGDERSVGKVIPGTRLKKLPANAASAGGAAAPNSFRNTGLLRRSRHFKLLARRVAVTRVRAYALLRSRVGPVGCRGRETVNSKSKTVDRRTHTSTVPSWG